LVAYTTLFRSAMSTSFSHLFEGGYAAGYYSYKWSEVLDADAFSYFKEKGLFNKDIAKKLQDNILSKGGTEDPEILYERFRGRKAKLEALLERAGFKSVQDRKSTRLNSSNVSISYAVFCMKIKI